MTYAFLVLGLILVAVFVSKRTAKVTLHVAFLKAVASVCFILTGLFAMAENPDCPKIVGALIAAGGIWGLLGDIALDLKYVFKKYEKEYLIAGFSCFGVGHIFYIAALIMAYGFNIKPTLSALFPMVVSVIIVFASEPLMKVKYGEYKKITIAYLVILGYVLGLSWGYLIFDYSVSALILSIGFLLFIGSDVFLSSLYFGATEKDRTNRVSIVLNHTLYYSAQFLIALSLLFINK